MHATAFLRAPKKHETGPAVALVGSDRFLKAAAIHALEGLVLGEEGSAARFDGQQVDIATVLDELRTVSMWSDRRLIVIDDADDLVSKKRDAFERYLENPAKKSVLVLDVKTFPKTTKLTKKVAKIGLTLECGPLKEADLVRWLIDESLEQHGKHLNRNAGALMVEVVGSEFGMLRQELGKLAAYVGSRAKIDVDDVRKLVGGWGGEEVWDMIRNTYGGVVGRAIDDLELLLAAGEAPNKLLGAISYVFVRMLRAVEISQSGRSLPAALREAGIYPQDVDRAATYIRRVGPRTLERMYDCLLETDAALKGGSRAADQLLLERLLVELAPTA